MKYKKNFTVYIFNILFCFFPISIIIGNQAINITSILIIIFTFLIYKKNIFKFEISFFDKVIFFLFFYILFVMIINIVESQIMVEKINSIMVTKSLFFFKYLILYLVLRFLFSKKIIKFKIFYIICATSAVIVSIDLFIQYFFGKNLIGLLPISERHYSGFFGQEVIAGGFIQKFSLFAILLPFIFFKKEYYRNFSLITLFALFLLGIILSGNRMPLILYLTSILMFILINNKYKKYFIKFFLSLSLFLLILFYTLEQFQLNTLNFYGRSKNLISTFFISDLASQPSSVVNRPYVVEFYCGKLAIKENPIFGGGIRSSRTLWGGCSSHPHNYFLEITAELGFVGLIMIVFLSYKLFLDVFRKFFYNFKNINQKILKISPPFLILVMEFFPFRSSGSFFTTGNATIIFITLAMLISFEKTRYINK